VWELESLWVCEWAEARESDRAGSGLPPALAVELAQESVAASVQVWREELTPVWVPVWE
jgi:hypothetical protein